MNKKLVTKDSMSLTPLAAVIAVLAAGAPVSSAVAADGYAGLEEVMVTARRMEESLQDVPASISVLTEDDLRRSGVDSVERVIGLTPGVSIVTNTAEVGDTQINIRGINGARDAENSVALVVDGILKTNTAQVAQMHGQLTQTEILKGPQGAYYGRNAAAGAIVMTTKKPGDEFTGDVKVQAGEESTFGATAVFDGPLGDKAGFVLFGDYFETDGHFRNKGPTPGSQGATVDAVENTTVGGRLLFTPSDTSEIDIKARYAKFEGSALKFNPVFHLPTFALPPGSPLFDEDVNDHNYDFIGNIKPENTQDSAEVSIKGTWELSDYTLTAWGLYSDVDQEWLADSTAATFYRFELQDSCTETREALAGEGYQLPAPQFLAADPFVSVFGPFGPSTCDGTQYQARSQTDFSAEIRLASNLDGAFNWSAGAYFLEMERDTSVSIAEDQGQGGIMNAYNAPDTTNPTSLMFADSFDTSVYAVFGSIDYDITDALLLSVALRYDREEREVSSNVPNVNDPATGNPINPGLPAVGMIPDADNTYEEWQPKISVAYALSDDWNLYGNWGVGFKAGGFNNQGSEALLDANFNALLGSGLNIGDEYDKETSSAFEVGAKGTLADGAVSFEIAAYYTEVTDMQFFEFFTGQFGLLRVVSNIDEVEILGAETSLAWSVSDAWTLFGSAAFNDSEIIDNSSRPGTEGNKSPYTAEYTVNLGVQYVAPLANDLELSFRADLRTTGPTWFHTVQENQVRTTFDLFFPGAGTADYSQTRRDTYSTLDMRLELATYDSWRVALYGLNVTDEDILSEVIPSAEFGGSFVAPGSGRVLGVELGYRF
ncbi:TonB-dependent receptor [Candidatus Litorirhabdus singularis]|nr:TonB-dependent receptor [Candidatus Litorirhabdus singularis]